MTTVTAGLAVRYRPDIYSDFVVEPVADEVKQTELVRHLILDLGRDAEPVTLIPQPDAPALAKIRRDIAEDILAQYAAYEITDNQAFGLLAHVAPGLHGTEGGEFFTLLERATDSHRDWTGLEDKSLSDFEPEMRDWDALDKQFRALFDQELDALMSHLDAHTTAHEANRSAA